MTAKQYIKCKAALRKTFIEVFQHTPTEMQLLKMTVIIGKFKMIMEQEGAA